MRKHVKLPFQVTMREFLLFLGEYEFKGKLQRENGQITIDSYFETVAWLFGSEKSPNQLLSAHEVGKVNK